MNWAILIVSGAMEAVWAVALERAEGFTKLIPSIIFIAALAASMLGLSHAVRSIPLGTAYAVWVASAPPSPSSTAWRRASSRSAGSRWRFSSGSWAA